MAGEVRAVGEPVEGWTPPRRPDGAVLEGRFVRVEPLSAARHAAELHAANAADDRIWDYLGYGPFPDKDSYSAWAAGMAAGSDPSFFALVDRATGRAAGVASYLRITPETGCIEVGHICLSPSLQRSPAATEAMALMMGWAFAAGYRRYEWKCDALNLPSRRAAARLGFSYEGTFRQHMIVKGRNRDTAWFSILDREWPALSAAFDRWLEPGNFDATGAQRRSLSAMTRGLRASTDPVTG